MVFDKFSFFVDEPLDQDIKDKLKISFFETSCREKGVRHVRVNTQDKGVRYSKGEYTG